MTAGRVFEDRYRYASQRAKCLSDLLETKWVDPLDATWVDAGTIDFIANQIDKAILEIQS